MAIDLKTTREELIWLREYFKQSARKADEASEKPESDMGVNWNRGRASAYRAAAGEVGSVIEWIDGK